MLDKRTHIEFRCFVKINNQLWVSYDGANGIFVIDLDNYTVKYMFSFDGIPFLKEYCHSSKIIQDENNLYFFPGFTESQPVINTYNMLSGRKKEISIPKDWCGMFETSGVVQVKRYVYIIQWEISRGIYYLNLDTDTVIKDEGISEKLIQFKGKKCAVSVEDNIGIISLQGTDKFVEIDFSTKAFRERKIPVVGVDIFKVVKKDDFYYILQQDSCVVYRWNIEMNEIKKYEVSQVERTSSIPPFWDVLFRQDEIVLLGGSANSIVKINTENDVVSKIDWPDRYEFLSQRKFQFTCCEVPVYQCDNFILLYQNSDNVILKLNLIDNTVEAHEIEADKNVDRFFESVFWGQINEKGYFVERACRQVEFFLDKVYSFTNKIYCEKTNIGNTIYHAWDGEL
ncbi:hypothetical protein IMSAGC009_01387 [Lachnospiraceae bacterium]|nr:hypothetical protein IMSAGC009_01387 [Lachnospiraceae bacterium]